MMSLHRRQILQIGGSSFFGLSLPSILSGREHTARQGESPKSVVLVFLTGGGSHLDTFDPKPNAPENTRGLFKAIPTGLSGVHFSEHVPQLAKQTDRLAIVRSMSHSDNRHLSGTHNTLTGNVQTFRGNANEDKELNRGDWPCYGGGVSLLAPRNNGLPSQVTLPNPLIEGHLTWPGQHAGFVGAKHDPWIIKGNPNDPKFKVDGIQLLDGLSIERVQQRRALLDQYNSQRSVLDDWARTAQFTSQQEVAYSMLTSGKMAKAFDIHKEPAKLRDRYGRHSYGQTLLLARRLVESGVPFVQANMGIVQTWDTHSANFPKLKDRLLPPLDQAVSTLLDDLDERGRLDDTLVIVVGEFGRTPRISTLPNNKEPGRDHWAWVYTALFAGGGVKGGQVIGASDRIGAYPVTTPYHPNDMGATVYQTLGIDPHTTIRDREGRPIPLTVGKVMDVLYG